MLEYIPTEINKMLIEFEDGTTTEIEKGVFAEIPEDFQKGETTLNFINTEEEEVVSFLRGTLSFLIELFDWTVEE